MKLLDLFCGAGGCSVGYARAGFDVVGWDSVAQPDYPYQFHQGDAMGVLADRDYLAGFDVIHASPPCPFYSHASNASGTAANHPALIEPVRDALRAWGGAYVIENVEGAGWAMDHPLLVCGWAMGLRHIRRHRLFESNVWLMSPGCLCPRGDSVSVFGDAGEDRRKATIAARGGTMRKRVDLPDAAALMGVEWITSRKAVSNAIPPAYTEYVGAQLVDAL